MRKHLVLNFVCLFFLCQATLAHDSGNIRRVNSKTTKSIKMQEDTTAYIKTNLANQKTKYRGKELNELLNSSKYLVKSYDLVYEHKPDGNGHFTCLRIYFEDKNSINRKLFRHGKFLFLDVYFNEPVEKGNAMAVFVKSFGV